MHGAPNKNFLKLILLYLNGDDLSEDKSNHSENLKKDVFWYNEQVYLVTQSSLRPKNSMFNYS